MRSRLWIATAVWLWLGWIAQAQEQQTLVDTTVLPFTCALHIDTTKPIDDTKRNIITCLNESIFPEWIPIIGDIKITATWPVSKLAYDTISKEWKSNELEMRNSWVDKIDNSLMVGSDQDSTGSYFVIDMDRDWQIDYEIWEDSSASSQIYWFIEPEDLPSSVVEDPYSWIIYDQLWATIPEEWLEWYDCVRIPWNTILHTEDWDTEIRAPDWKMCKVKGEDI